MHIVLAGLYGFTIWFSCIAYAIIVEGPAVWVALAGPFIVSAAIAGVIAVDAGLRKVGSLARRHRRLA